MSTLAQETLGWGLHHREENEDGGSLTFSKFTFSSLQESHCILKFWHRPPLYFHLKKPISSCQAVTHDNNIELSDGWSDQPDTFDEGHEDSMTRGTYMITARHIATCSAGLGSSNGSPDYSTTQNTGHRRMWREYRKPQLYDLALWGFLNEPID